MENLIKVAITHGDINGIGYEVIIKALSDLRMNELCTPIIYGSSKVAAYHRKVLNVQNFNFNPARTIDEIDSTKTNLVNCVDDAVRVELGKSTEVAGEASFQSLEAATADLLAGHVDVLVTAPINKHNIQSAGFQFPGHTEYLAVRAGAPAEDALMLMVSDNLRIGVVTGHIPLAEVSRQLTTELILKKLRIIGQSLLSDFGIRKPRIAVLGLNPHAGDNGLLGDEEATIINPAIEQANELGMVVAGPFPADGFFAAGHFAKFDAILAMYHDQGLIPFKTLEGERGVNFTAGLPIVRTSPAHGTAFSLAGEGVASEESMRQAIYLALDIHRNRKMYREMSANVLEIRSKEDLE